MSASEPTRYSDGEYLANNSDWHVADSPWKVDKIRRLVEGSSIRFDRVAEVGCGAGEILRLLSLCYSASQFEGFDISSDAPGFWRPAKGLSYFQADFLATSASYDTLLLIDVFEHVPDYLGFLKSLSTRADHFIFNIPLDMHALGVLTKNQMRARKRYGHLHYFSQETALATLVESGYRIERSFLAPGYRGVPRKSRSSVRQRLVHVPRRLAEAASPAFAARLLGGHSLFVLASTNRVASV